jgi:hypothetical protein
MTPRQSFFSLLSFILVTSFHITSTAAILVEENGVAVPNSAVSSSTSSTSYNSVFNTSDSIRASRRVAVGLQAAGSQGLLGMNLELNFDPALGFMLSYGVGSSFQSLSFAVKKHLGGEAVSPYISAGYSRWFSNGGDLKDTSPSFLTDKFLSESEKRTGNFAHNIFYPGAGLQYTQLSGPWTGTAVYAEVMILVDTEEFISAPTGALGFLYYF